MREYLYDLLMIGVLILIVAGIYFMTELRSYDDLKFKNMKTTNTVEINA